LLWFELCNVLKASEPPLKRLFCQDYNGTFRFKGAGGAGEGEYLPKNVKILNWGDEKLTRLLALTSKIVWR
jgi:hypothetical protein